ncbi:TonB-dependent receptor [uncultured Tenacibaculum sp.]|uniref:SusC/RagA family TonB-linked outer membrane protein n=1 Tax=uncultured Tenacibaculum sp. TaxID=174713 RepID=UPI00261C5FC9|nr:TonB-dependent receptor [uncultured Tenacibaculum sp.]
MRTKFNGILTLFLALIVQISFAQERTISGTVSDESGPLPGVTILKKGTTQGTETDFDGNYSINVKTGDVLVFSFVGMKTAERTVGTSNQISVVLEGNNLLEEVVVVAYGTQKREAIVGSVAVVDSDIIDKQQVVSVTNAIQGAVPGVSIIAAGGQPGDNPTIRIRGVGSINAGADPLIILDGSPYNGNLNTISADQIESMSVLKDASSTALYGSRAANGVILINTKKGRKNSPTKVTFNSSLGVASRAVEQHKMLGTDDIMRYNWEAVRNSNMYASGQDAVTAGTNASNSLISLLGYNPYGPGVPNPVDPSGNLVTTDKLWETDWQDLMFNDAAIRSEYGLTASGGTENSTFFFSMNYLDQEGSISESDFERLTTRINATTDVNDWLELGLNVGYSTQEQNNPTQSGSSYQSAVQWTTSVSPIYPLYRRDANGQLILDGFGDPIYDYGDNPQIVNGVRPVFEGENSYGSLFNYINLNKRHQFNASTFAQVDFTDYLNFKTTVSYEQYFFDSFSYVHNQYGYAANAGGRVTQDRDVTTTKNITNSLNFNKSFGDHNVSANLIHEAYELNYSTLNAQGTGFLPNVYVLNGATVPEGIGGAEFDQAIESYLGRVSYNYNEKYFVEGSWRTDNSSQFSAETRRGEFFSLGGSWIVSKEKFLESSSFLSYLKLKASYGELGNNKVGYFPYTNNFETGWNELDNTGVLIPSLNDPLLTWETTAIGNYGVDFRLFNDKISGSVEYYNRESKALIYDEPIPSSSTGFTEITTNTGSLLNSGVEVTFNADIINNKNFNWRAGLNLAFEKNEITELTQDQFINGTKLWKEGNSLYEFYVREYAGVDSATGDALWYIDVTDPNTGEPTGERDVTSEYADATRYETGKQSLPDFSGGFNTNMSYKNWDLNLLFNFSFGGYVMDYTYASLMGSGENLGRAMSVDIKDRWQQPGDITNVPRLSNSNNDYNATSDRFLFKNDFVRLKALNVGYNFDSDVIKNVGLSNLRLYLQADNLWTYQSHKGIDPEQSIAGTTDNRSFNQRIISFGFNIQL